VHVRNLRVKIRPYDERIETVRGIGYRFGENQGQ
jgi:DNA-binding response OmpR family regulator